MPGESKAKRVKVMMFTTQSCPNCRVVKAMLEDISKEYAITMEEWDLERWPIKALMHQVATVPSILIGKHIVSRGRIPTKKELIDAITNAA